MRFHHNLLVAVNETLNWIFNEDLYADKAIQRILKKDKRWGSRDRGFIAEVTYDIVRYKRLYAAIADVREPFNREQFWRLTAVWIVLRGHQLPEWKEYASTPVRKIKGKFDEFSSIRKIRESIPDWMDEMGMQAIPEIWEKEIHALNQQADVILRANTLKTSRDNLRKKLQEENVFTAEVKGYRDALKLVERENVFTTKAFQDGMFEVQDAGSQHIAPFLQAEEGMRVVDACAGAGGKTLHLASLMKNKGQIIAMDIFKHKLQELKRRARRAGAHNIETRVIDSTKAIKKLAGKMDRVLIDAPCTGLGVLRRNPDTKWKLEPAFVERIVKEQQEILQSYSRMCKDGGKLVYATCSILPRENRQQVAQFLNSEAGKGFTLEEEKSLFAHSDGFDGFYMARMVKNS